MPQKLLITLLIFVNTSQFSFAQQETYTVKLATFSSDKYDEFSPVFYKNGIVFCTNRNNSLKGYSTSQDKGLFKINYIDTAGKASWQNSRLLSKELTTKLNDGPVTFNSTGDTIYYSRNLEVNNSIKDISSKRNKLGLFSAILVGGKWTKVVGLRGNNEWYNVATPWLSSDGKRLYFSSDKPGGFGGFDLYYCNWKGGYWNDPVNLGPVINTSGNEGYPFINPSGELFFSSDGHPGLGGKDIFFSRFSGTGWLPPVRLDAPVNSQYDDFGIVTDSLIAQGYFSSTRNKTADIFHFKTNFPQIFYTNIQKENQYCFIFSDSGTIEVDTLRLKYVWDFGDGKKSSGAIVKHCFPGPGKYNIKLDIIDRRSGNLFFSKLSYILDLTDYVQPYISCPDIIIAGDPVELNGLKSYLPGYKILNYAWDFGDGTRLLGPEAKHVFREKGEFWLNLGLTLKSDSSGNIHKTGVSKKITVVSNLEEKNSYLIKNPVVKSDLTDVRNSTNAFITGEHSTEEIIKKDALFRIQLVSSKNRINLKNSIFRDLISKYTVTEEFDNASGTYVYYTGDKQISLMSTYPLFRDIVSTGFKGAKVILNIITNQIERELYKLKLKYGIQADNYFDSNGQLMSGAYFMLDQIVILMNRNPEMRLQIEVYLDNMGSAANNLKISQARAQVLVNYLINRGINSRRLIAKGYGEANQLATVIVKDRKLNRRVDFTLSEK